MTTSNLLVLLFCVFDVCVSVDEVNDDFTPTVYSPRDDVQLAHNYPHLSTSLEEQDNTFMSKDEGSNDYIVSLFVFPALVAGICLACIICVSCCLLFRCFLLGCKNLYTFLVLLFCNEYGRKSTEDVEELENKLQRRYNIYSRTFPFLLVCGFVAIVWVWEGAYYISKGVDETRQALTLFGNIAQSISDEWEAMSVSGSRIDSFLAHNTCPSYVSNYLDDINENFHEFTNTTDKAARMTASVQPAVDNASYSLDRYWREFQELAFDLSAVVFCLVILIYALGVCMKTAILIRLGLILTIVLSLILCVLVFFEMVFIMGYSDFCMSPTYNIERWLSGMPMPIKDSFL